MAKGKYQKWLEQANLERITNWALKGCTYAEIAANMGIGERTLYAWVDRHEQIMQAIKTGRGMSVDCLENMAFKVAMGLAEEEVAIKVKGRDGSESVQIVTRRIPPHPAMLMFLLKNRAGYRSEPETKVTVETAPRFYFDRSQAESD